MKELSPAGASQ